MRGGSPALFILALWLSACASPPAAPAPPPPAASSGAPSGRTALPVPVEPAPPPALLEGIKGGTSAPVQTKAEASPKREGAGLDVIRQQREVVARNPSNDEEKLRLALLLSVQGELDEAERVVSTMKTRAHRLMPYFECYLKRELGDHKEAGKALGELVDADRKVVGFVIERAQLCTKVRRYREYTAAETDKVKPGGVVLLYVEPRNFTLQRSQDKHIVHLKYDWKLYDDRSTEHPVREWDQAPPEDREDRVTYAGPVNEFYQSFRLPLPENLAMGHYRIKVTVTDAHTGKNDRVWVPITVSAVERTR